MKARQPYAARPVRHGAAAFTLTELLVVIVVSGIMAALLFPAMAQSRRKAQEVQCIGNLHQLGLGLQMVLSNNHGYPLFVENQRSCWVDELEREGLGISQPATNFMQQGVWRCPAAEWPNLQAPLVPMSYGYNAYGVLPVGNPTNAPGLLGHYDLLSDTRLPIRESEVAAPDDMMAMGDNFDASLAFMREDLYTLQNNWNAGARHQNRANVVFCDGHVGTPTLNYLFVDTSDEALSRWNRDHSPHLVTAAAATLITP